jgi:hypothetical protein
VLEKIMKRILCYLRAALIARTDAIGPLARKQDAKH